MSTRFKEEGPGVVYTNFGGYYNGNYSIWGSAATSDLYRSMTGEDIGRFHYKQSHGSLLPHTSYTNRKREGEVLYYYERLKNVANDEWIVSDKVWDSSSSWIIPDTHIDAYFAAQEIDRFVQEAVYAIMSRGFDTLTFIAELHHLRDQFTNITERFIAYLKDWRLSGKAWLEYRFAWRTLAYDLKDLSEVCANLEHEFTRVSERRGATFTDTSSFDVVSHQGDHGKTFSHVDSYTVGLRGSVTADIKVPPFEFNALQTIWEVTPFSFIMDWIINIGAFIASFDFLRVATDHTQSVGAKIEMRRVGTVIDDWCTYPITSFDASGSSVHEYTLIKRVPSNVPLNAHFNIDLGHFRWLDLLAIIWQIMQGSGYTGPTRR